MLSTTEVVTIVGFQMYLKDISKKTMDERCEKENQNQMAWLQVTSLTDMGNSGLGEKFSTDR